MNRGSGGRNQAGRSGSDDPPDWTSIDRELRRKGVTLQTLWSEYHRQHPDGYRYARFCQLYRAWKCQQDVVLRQVYKAGEKMFVDFAGLTLPITDPKTGAVTPTYLFVAALGASSYTFVLAVPTQDRFWWLMAHGKALEFFGGVPALIVPDNPKTGVTHACLYDPERNPASQEFAEHYGVAILPTRPKKPRDKAKVESAVPFAERFLLARLRNPTFFSVAEANDAIRPLLEELNHRPFQKREGSRASLFAELERPALCPLPVRRDEYAAWKRLRVNVELLLKLDIACHATENGSMKEEHLLSTGQTAKRLGVSVRTVYRWEAAGRLKPFTRLPSGQRRFSVRDVDALLRQRAAKAPRCAVYARVSSEKPNEAGDLERQKERLVAAAAAKGYEVTAVVAEQASALNEKRRGLKRLFGLAASGKIDVVLIEFKDRLARFGFGYLAEAFAAYGVRIEVLEGPVATDATQELVDDMLAIVSCFAARLYGSRSREFRHKVMAAAKEAATLAD